MGHRKQNEDSGKNIFLVCISLKTGDKGEKEMKKALLCNTLSATTIMPPAEKGVH
jgi:hypothetical protein